MAWDSIQPNRQDVKRDHVKARLLTGTFILQSTKFKFNSSEVAIPGDPQIGAIYVDWRRFSNTFISSYAYMRGPPKIQVNW